MIQGRLDRFNEMRQWSDLVIEREAPLIQALLSGQIQLVEVTVAEGSTLVKGLLHHTEFRRRFGANVLAIRRDELVRRVNLAYVPIRAGDRLLLQGSDNIVNELEASQEFSEIRIATEEDLIANYRLQERIFVVRVPRDSKLGGSTLAKSRIGDAFDFRLLATFREGTLQFMPEPDEVILGGDLLLLQGRPEDLDVLWACKSSPLPKRCRPTLISLNLIVLAHSKQHSRRNLRWPGHLCPTSIFTTNTGWNLSRSGGPVKQFDPTWIGWYYFTVTHCCLSVRATNLRCLTMIPISWW